MSVLQGLRRRLLQGAVRGCTSGMQIGDNAAVSSSSTYNSLVLHGLFLLTALLIHLMLLNMLKLMMCFAITNSLNVDIAADPVNIKFCAFSAMIPSFLIFQDRGFYVSAWRELWSPTRNSAPKTSSLLNVPHLVLDWSLKLL